jgi:sn-glycerol 3-phosphate transport system ATP-binding protein
VFVAGFIGSPAMNFLAAKVGPDRKSVELAGTGAAGSIILPLERPTSASAGTAVALGVRPEHLHPAADGPLQFEVELAEPLGADTLLHGRFGTARELVTVRQGGHVIAKPGEKRHFKVDPGHLHLFDSQTGKRLADA